jgi:hypothetical protein
METTKKFLNIAIGLSILIGSLSLFMFSVRDNRAIAQTGATLPSGVVVAGSVMVGNGFGADFYVLGFDPKEGKVVSLGKISPKEMRN